MMVYYFYHGNNISPAAFVLNYVWKRMILREKFVEVRINIDIFLSQIRDLYKRMWHGSGMRVLTILLILAILYKWYLISIRDTFSRESGKRCKSVCMSNFTSMWRACPSVCSASGLLVWSYWFNNDISGTEMARSHVH